MCKYFFLFIGIVLSCGIAYAQDKEDSRLLPDSALDKYLVKEITFEGNDKTKEIVIERELFFKQGDSLSLYQLELAIEKSKTNLLKLPLFNYLDFHKSLNGNEVSIRVVVEERWYIWPQFAVINNDRNFNSWFKTKDASRLDFYLAIKKYNVLGLNHVLSIGGSYGYTKELSVSYKNIFLDRKQHHFLNISGTYLQQKSLFYRTIENKLEDYTDSGQHGIISKHAVLGYAYRPRYKSKHAFQIIYNTVGVSDSLNTIAPNYLAGDTNENSYFALKYNYSFDNRDSRSYPLVGNRLDITMMKMGLGIVPGQDIDLFHVQGSIKQYYRAFNRFFLSHSFSIRKTFENSRPYYYRKGMGYEDYLRGFEYYVISGDDYYLLKNTIKFQLLKKKVSYLNFIPIKKFKKIHYSVYLTSFFDAGYAQENDSEILLQNSLSNKLIYSTGFGLDIATYYDRVYRIEYSFNSLGESGIFIHFSASI